MKKICVVIIILVLLFSIFTASTALAQTSINQDNEKAKQLINTNQILKSLKNQSNKVGIGVVNEVTCRVEELGKGQTIFTYAEILVNIPLTENIKSGQTIIVKYIGGRVGDKEIIASIDWRYFAGDSISLPEFFDLREGQSIMFFAEEYTNSLTGYIPYETTDNKMTPSKTLRFEPQPSTAVTEAQGYGFSWDRRLYLWSDLPQQYYIDPEGTNDIDGSGTTREFNAIHAGYITWEYASYSGIDFTYAGTHDYDSWTDYAIWDGDGNQDGYSVIGWATDYGYQNGSALAITYHKTYWNGTISRSLEDDIMMVDDIFTAWTIGSALLQYDTQSVVTHEVGHVVGLGHVTTASNNQQTMYYSIDYMETQKRDLEWGDLNGVHYLYPEHNDANSDDDASDSIGSANLVERLGWPGYDGRLCRLPSETDTNDYYKFYGAATMPVTISLQPPTSADFDLELYDPSGNLVAYSRQNGDGVTDSITRASLGVSGFWVIRVYTTETNGQESNGVYQFWIDDRPCTYASSISWSGSLSGAGNAIDANYVVGDAPDGNYGGIYGYSQGDAAAIIVYLSDVMTGTSNIYIYGQGITGTNAHISVYVSSNNIDWTNVGYLQIIGGPTTVLIGTATSSYRYVGISIYIDSGPAALAIDCVCVT